MTVFLFRALVLTILALLAWTSAPPLAQGVGAFYLSSDLGINFAPGFDFFGNSNAQGSLCFPFINPDPSSREAAGCPTMGTGWKSTFDNGQGILAGVGAGYRLGGPEDPLWGRLRIEVEYVFRESVYDQTTPILSSATGVTRDKLSNEVFRAVEYVGSLTSHNLFGNLYYDFTNSSRVTPYIGFGAGFGVTDLDNSRIGGRHQDWRQISTGSELPNAYEVRRNLAGTTSSYHGTNRDTMFGYQVLFGMDVALTETLSVGLKGRWADFGTMRYDGTLDMVLSTTVPEDYHNPREVDGVALFAVSANLKVRF